MKAATLPIFVILAVIAFEANAKGCDTDKDCPKGLECCARLGYCVPPGKCDCKKDEHCQQGKICCGVDAANGIYGQCKWPWQCKEDRPCESIKDCPKGQKCCKLNGEKEGECKKDCPCYCETEKHCQEGMKCCDNECKYPWDCISIINSTLQQVFYINYG